jgi:hypothetical protein
LGWRRRGGRAAARSRACGDGGSSADHTTRPPLCRANRIFLQVNPLAETPDGKIVVADAKINFDDNAGFRQSVS